MPAHTGGRQGAECGRTWERFIGFMQSRLNVKQWVATQEETFSAEASVYACALYARHMEEIFSGGKDGMT